MSYTSKSDIDRAAALRFREHLLSVTRSEKNLIPADGKTKKNNPYRMLPDALQL